VPAHGIGERVARLRAVPLEKGESGARNSQVGNGVTPSTWFWASTPRGKSHTSQGFERAAASAASTIKNSPPKANQRSGWFIRSSPGTKRHSG
jgi:hypothetical protein